MHLFDLGLKNDFFSILLYFQVFLSSMSNDSNKVAKSMMKSFPTYTGMLLCLILISGLGLGDAIFFSKPLKILEIEIPKSLLYILICHLGLMLLFLSKIRVGRFTLTVIMLASLVMFRHRKNIRKYFLNYFGIFK